VRNIIRAGVAVIVLLLAFSAPLAAGPLEDGLAALQRGDYALAMRHWRPLADQGNAVAQYNLALMYENGHGVRQDYATAVSWYRKAADQGYAVAQRNLGLMYLSGRGVPQNDATAFSWFRKAANQGLEGAQNDLGIMYENGRGVAQDFAAAASWYRKAADQDYAVAQYNLALMYLSGRGVPQDYVSAHMWFNLAAGAGNQSAVRNLNIVAGWMTPAQIAEAQGLARGLREQWAKNRVFPSQPSFAPAAKGTLIPLQLYGGVFTVPVSINDKLTLNFMLDSGAADVSIPADVVSTLTRTGTLSAADFLGSHIYRLADGSTVPSQTFRIKSLKLGEKTIVENVTGSISPAAGDPLLGQSFLRRFKSWSIDNQRQVLVLE
jgi:TPR repeat protein/predicted aspartyl protease